MVIMLNAETVLLECFAALRAGLAARLEIPASWIIIGFEAGKNGTAVPTVSFELPAGTDLTPEQLHAASEPFVRAVTREAGARIKALEA